MGEDWRLAAPESVPQQQLLRNVRQVFVAPDDMTDAHVDVVDDVGQDEDRRAVAAHDDEILNGRKLDLSGATDHVVARQSSIVGHPEPQCATGARTEAAVAAPAVVPRGRIAFGALDDLL